MNSCIAFLALRRLDLSSVSSAVMPEDRWRSASSVIGILVVIKEVVDGRSGKKKYGKLGKRIKVINSSEDLIVFAVLKAH